MRTLKWIFIDESIFNKPDFYMKCPVKLIKNEKVGQTIITELCVKFFGRRGSATKFQNISVTSSTASQSLHANKKWKLTILNQIFLYLFNSYFQLSDFKCIKSSRVLNFAILGRRYFTGFYFRDFKRQIWKRGIKFQDSDVLNFISIFNMSTFDGRTRYILRNLYELRER